jgi:uncharacterized protein YciI
MRMLHFYTMRGTLGRIHTVAARHAAYWRKLGAHGYAEGPFADRSGGCITFEADSVEQARRLVAGDPFMVEGLIETSYVEEWSAERAPVN